MKRAAAGEREPTVRVVGVDGSGVSRLSRRRDVGVEVLEPKNVRVVTSGRRNAVDVEAGDLIEARGHYSVTLTGAVSQRADRMGPSSTA